MKSRPNEGVKALDFGLAKALRGRNLRRAEPRSSYVADVHRIGYVWSASFMGTPLHMAPEQARGRAVDPVVPMSGRLVPCFYEMLTGAPAPSAATRSRHVLAAVLRQDVDWTALPASHPAAFGAALVERCLDCDPKTRLRDVGEARVALSRVHESASSLDRTGKSRSRRRNGPRWSSRLARSPPGPPRRSPSRSRWGCG